MTSSPGQGALVAVLLRYLSRCLGQTATIAGMDAPTDDLISNYQGSWQVEAYAPPAISDDT